MSVVLLRSIVTGTMAWAFTAAQKKIRRIKNITVHGVVSPSTFL